MKKKLSQTAQIQLLKRLRRMCPFAVFSGSYGYTCGGMVGGYVLLQAWPLAQRKLAIACSHAPTCASKHTYMATT
ncbi:hypothetical protein [Leyella stercorea]|uniref:hypothetical protein n=1 Tax=Leyella stercorea TaxID=363265 RepID=UPI00242FFF10|nr:hypothetical protein [Leyella stercorea]